MKNIILKYKSELIGVTLGAIAGSSYWYFVGCASGSCAITSSPVNSSLYGAFMGGILGSILKRSNNEENKKVYENDRSVN
jgi:Family of unknown function (DUF6132)